ncbi:MAG: lipoprotein, partial [Clostridia bacterium]|nr:lipoprotein [Clostridia bacterium]
MKRLLSIFAAAVLVISTAFTLTACGEKEITAEAAYEQLTAALTTTVIDADQLSITLKTTVNAKVYDSESDESPAKLEDKKMAVDFGVRATTDENRNVNAGMLWLKITEGEEAVVDVDTYLKEGFTYSHAMISSLNESYSYDEQESPEMLDLSDVSVEEIQEFVNRFKETFPEPTKATVKKETYKLTWKITNNNLPEYITAVRTLSDESITTEEALAIASEVDIKKGEV